MEQQPATHKDEQEDAIAQEALGSTIPSGYYTSATFLGSTLVRSFHRNAWSIANKHQAIAVGCISGYGGWLLAASSLETINQDLGPSPNALWMPLANTLANAVGMILFGRLSDIFGRRWFMITSTLIVLIGSIAAATTRSIDGIIAANALIGLGSAALLSYAITLAELVPYKARGYVSCLVFVAALPVNAFGPIVAKSFIAHTKQTWRWAYYLNIITTSCSGLLFFAFYHPPTFSKLHTRRSKMQMLKSLDFVGILLLVAGMVLFLMGLNWGGTMYPWRSARVIATIVVGIMTLVGLVAYELWVARAPIIPPSMMKNAQCMLIIGVACVGGMIYYGMSVFWPEMVSNLFTSDLEYQGWLTMCCTAGAALGNIVAGACFQLGRFRWQLLCASILMTAFFGAMSSVDQNSQNRGIAFSILGTFFAGWLEGPTMAAITYTVDQADIGLAVGMLNSNRVCLGGVAVAIYDTALDSRRSSLASEYVPKVAVAGGLPPASIATLLEMVEEGASWAGLPGMNPTIEAAVEDAIKDAFGGGCQLVFQIIIALGGLAIIGSLFVNSVDEFLTDDVSRRLHASKQRSLGEEGGEKQSKNS
jgi:MFS family permease